MATTLKTKNSVVTTVAPTSLAQGELAVNITDKKMWVGNAATTPVQIVGAGATNRAGGSNTQVQYNSSGDLAGSANMTFSGTALTLANDASISGLTVGKGGSAVSTNTALGYQALTANTSGDRSVAVGYQASAANTSGINTAVGYLSLNANTSGTENTAIGFQSMAKNTTGNYNSGLSDQALYNNTTGSNNVGVGFQALVSNTTASSNTAVGYQAGYSGTTAQGNTLIGNSTGYSLTTGSFNTFIGPYGGATSGAGGLITTGGKNTIIGSYNGNQGGLDIRTASNWVVLSDGDGNPYLTLNQTSGANRQLQFDGAQFYPAPDNTVKLGVSNFRWTTVYATTGTINTSDATQKQQIRNLDDAEKAVAKSIKGLIKAFKFNDAVEAKGDGARIHIGVLAQEVQDAFKAQGLDADKYAMFCSDTWYELDGKSKSEEGVLYTKDTTNAIEITRLGVRYEQLLAFVISTL